CYFDVEPSPLHSIPTRRSSDLDLSRADCIAWMEKHGYPRPPRSACVYCPFHSDAEWLLLKRNDPEGFAEAVEVERRLQSAANRVDRKSTRLNSSHVKISYAVFC